MENEQPPIEVKSGLSQAEIDAKRRLKALGRALKRALDQAGAAGADQRSLAVATTHLQTGMMWAIRAVAKPEGF